MAQRKLPPQRTQATVLTGADLREHRRRLGISQAALARQANYDPSYICHMEHGKRPIGMALAQTLLDVLRAIEAQRSDLMTRSSTMLRHGA